MKMEYGIPIPRGVQKDWDATSMVLESGGKYLRRYHAPEDWGNPTKCVAWFDRFGRLRLCVGHYANGRSATVRHDANGKYKATFGAASVDRSRDGQDRVDGLGAQHESAVGATSAETPHLDRPNSSSLGIQHD